MTRLWRTWLEQARVTPPTGGEWQQAQRESDSWQSCAVGERREALEVKGVSFHCVLPQPVSGDIYSLGMKFNRAILTQRVDLALDILNQIERRTDLTSDQKEVLSIAALFHDVVFDPKAKNNEEKSAEIFLAHSKRGAHTDLIVDIILDTKTRQPTTRLSQVFQSMDLSILQGSMSELIEWERSVFPEYQFLDFKEYRKQRLTSWRT